MRLPLDRRPLLVAIAGANGAGKTTFYFSHLQSAGLRFVNADFLARELTLDAYVAADLADSIREALAKQGESFVFETVFSDPAGAKIKFLKRAWEAGYTVVLCFIGISGPEVSDERVAMRVSQGGHDVPLAKLTERPRSLNNLRVAIRTLPHVWIFDNDDLGRPFRLIAVIEDGKVVTLGEPVPNWLKGMLC